MSVGLGNIVFTDSDSGTGGGGTVVGALDGVSLDADNNVVWGEAVDDITNKAKLIQDHDLPFNGFSMSFLNGLNTDSVISSLNIFPDQSVGSPLLDYTQRGNGATDQSGNGGFFYTLTPSNYGITYPSNFAPGDEITMNRWWLGYALQNSNDNDGIVGMPDAVLNFGYNITNAGGQATPGDAAWRMGFETHFINTLEGAESNFEFHLPEVITFSGQPFRINSYYVDKTNAVALNVRIIQQTNFIDPLDAGLPVYYAISRQGDGGQLSFLPASHTGNPVMQIAVGSATDLVIQSFGGGDLFFTNNHALTENQMLGNGDNIFNVNIGLTPPTESIGVTVVGNTTTPDHSAQLSVVSTTRGMLPPQMTTLQKLAIVSPAKGLLVSDITLNQLSYFNGTLWINI